MEILLVALIICILIALITYLIILGGNMSKTDDERKFEDEEQMNYLKKYNKKSYNLEENMNMEIKRGQLFYAALDETYVGSEQTGVRPVVILQNNIGNEHSPTVIVAPITSKINSKAIMPTHVFVQSHNTGLKQDSIILAEQIKTIDKMRLKHYIGELERKDLQSVDKALIVSLGIDLENIRKKFFHKEGIEEKTEFVTRKQIASYGMIARENLKHSGNLQISNEDFGKYILTLIDLYTPDDAEIQADKIKYNNYNP